MKKFVPKLHHIFSIFMSLVFLSGECKKNIYKKIMLFLLLEWHKDCWKWSASGKLEIFCWKCGSQHFKRSIIWTCHTNRSKNILQVNDDTVPSRSVYVSGFVNVCAHMILASFLCVFFHQSETCDAQTSTALLFVPKSPMTTITKKSQNIQQAMNQIKHLQLFLSHT